ncbi:unnamed protein product [Amoebophrya sp. A25]|nr:unnamed protein product [Amoebophrya sp. A25]|eukprot:GSA25T00003052001.1
MTTRCENYRSTTLRLPCFSSIRMHGCQTVGFLLQRTVSSIFIRSTTDILR